MGIPLVDLQAQLRPLQADVHAAMAKVIDHGQFIMGPEVKEFEKEIAGYLGTRHAIGVASGTDALHLALLACGIKPGDEVITTPFTFVATVEMIVHCGARPVFVDIEPGTYNLDPSQIEARITPRTRAILPVHLYGHSADMEAIGYLARKHNLKVIEDCAQALGAEFKGNKVGSLGDAGCLSFFPSKNLGAFGDGGMVVCNDSKVADTVRTLHKHGADTTYYYRLAGFNSRLDTLQAAVLLVKLRQLDKWVELRRNRAALYGRLLEGIRGLEAPVSRDYGKHCFNYYTIRLAPQLDRDGLRKHLKASGVDTMVYYPLCLHLHEAYLDLKYKKGDFPESERAQEQVLSLPMYPELSDCQVEEVVNAIASWIDLQHENPSA